MKRQQQGFTIIELMIATLVFSVIMLVITTAMIQIGHIYYKGITSIKTQEAARGVIEDISRSIQLSGGAITPSMTPNGSNQGVCIDQRRYSFLPGKQLTDDASPSSDQTGHALVVDDTGSPCAGVQPQDLGSASVAGTELLGPNMRLAALTVTQSGDLYTIKVRVVYGDTDLLDPETKSSCLDIRSGSQFCAVSELTTTVQKRIQ